MFPTLSVTVIGLLVGVAVVLVRRRGWMPLVMGVAAAWVGFGLGALLGIALDVLFATGIWVAVLGHISALLVATVVTGGFLRLGPAQY